MAKTYAYWLEDNGYTVGVLYRKTKPRMSAVVSENGNKWHVWYIEETKDYCAARCEPLDTTPSP